MTIEVSLTIGTAQDGLSGQFFMFFFLIIIFCIVVDKCDLVHDVEAIFCLP